MKKTAIILAIIAILSLIAACFAGCGESEQTGDSTSADAAPAATDEITSGVQVAEDGVRRLVSGGEAIYTLVRPTNMGNTGINAAVYLRGRLEEISGVRLTIMEDFVKNKSEIDENACELLFGMTNRTDGEEGPKSGFSIRTERNRVVILAGSEAYLRYAADYFVDTILQDPELAEVGEGKIFLKKDIDYVSEKFSYLAEILRSSDSLSSTSERLFTVPYPSDQHKNPQGGWIDPEGRFYYQVFLNRDNESNEANNQDIIVKYDMIANRINKVSGILYLNHANDITWYPEKNCLAVVHNNPNRKNVSLVDPDTLQLIETVNLNYTIYCMDYNPENDMFVIGLSGGQNFRFLKRNFKDAERTIHTSTPLTTGYTTQGCASDANFIYFVLYKQNVITVYDWSGNFVTLISFDVGSIEPENISVVNDEIYVTCNSGGAAVYRITPHN